MMRMSLSQAMAYVGVRRARHQAFAATFDQNGPGGIHAERVLAALRDFCCATKPTVGGSVEETYRLAGRRDVWLFITEQLNFTEEQIRQFVEAHDDYFGDE